MPTIIEDYTFGRIKISGAVYSSDVIVYPDCVNSSWWRKEGHNLELEDLSELLSDPPATLVIGTGYFGRMQVSSATVAGLRAKGIEVLVARTKKAAEDFNRLQEQGGRIVAALHLTC